MSAPNQTSRGNRPRRRFPRNGKKRQTHAGGEEGLTNTPQPQLEVATPPLVEAITSDAMAFTDLANVLDPILIETLTHNLGFQRMTPVQEATLPVLLRNRVDCLGQAKTGTGKTLAFLLPAIQTMMQHPRPASLISLLVISPTRELAMQIAKEATSLLARLPRYTVRLAIGGTNKDREERDILSGCDILVATPGRLYDHLSDQRIVALFAQLNTLVLDEADRLLDMGFMQALKDIIACLPDKQQTQRQGMLFSATMGPHVEQFAHLALSPGYARISTIPPGELNTHERVSQLLITVPSFIQVLPATVSAIRAEIALANGAPFKAIVFAPTAALADWYALTLAHVPHLPPVSVLHSRISQAKRTNVTNAFRTATSAILVATDVIARGMDFPNVSTVLQVGIPADRESYIHRLGRTARAGRDGKGVFIIAEAEAFFPNTRLKEIDFEPATVAVTADDAAVVHAAAARADIQGKVYQAWMGYYKNHLKGLGWTPERLVAEANRYALDALGAGGVPEIQKSTVGKMGLKGVKGLNVVPNAPHSGRGGRGGGGGGGRERGRGGG